MRKSVKAWGNSIDAGREFPRLQVQLAKDAVIYAFRLDLVVLMAISSEVLGFFFRKITGSGRGRQGFGRLESRSRLVKAPRAFEKSKVLGSSMRFPMTLKGQPS